MSNLSIRLSLTLRRQPGRNAGWQAEFYTDDGAWSDPYRGHGRTRTQARDDLAQVLRRALAAAREPFVLVIGGDPDHAKQIHAIRPTPYGWIVHRIHHGQSAVAWGSYDTREDAITAVLRHVGGNPAVVNL
jgi:hypothetical protein